METSPLIKSSHPSVVSPDGLHIATLLGCRLDVRRTCSFQAVRTIDLPSSSSRFLCLRWSPPHSGLAASTRILVADEDTVRVWDLYDTEWCATIDNGSGGIGKIANVEFGFDDTQVLVFSSFGAQVACWSLWTGRSVEIKDPKFSTRGYGHSRAGSSGIFALLSRPATQDIVTLHVAGSYEMMTSFTLLTVDAQGLKWSPDGRWIAIWDTPSTGYRIYIFTADGHLYRTYSGDYFDDDLVGLGVKSIEWSPSGDLLAVGGYETTVTLLSTRTFSPAIQFSHSSVLKPVGTPIYLEQASTTVPHSYALSNMAITPPTSTTPPGDAAPKIGISILSFNATGTLLATKSDDHPTTAWIFDLSRSHSRAILVQHAPVKCLLWHPHDPEVLLIQCEQTENLLYLWDAREDIPRVLHIPADIRFTGRAEAKWIPTSPDSKYILQFGNATGTVVAFPYGTDSAAAPRLQADNARAQQKGGTFSSAEEVDDDEDDSLFEILSGRNAGGEVGDVTVDDTFRYRAGVGAF